MSELLAFLNANKDSLTIVAGTIGGGFALWRWTIDQKWRRVQYAQSLIKEFMNNENTRKAFEILDTEGEVIFLKEHGAKKKTTIEINDDFLNHALSTFDQQSENSDEEIIVRDLLDSVLNELGIFQSHIDAKLIKPEDIKPYLEYWVRALSGRGHVRGSKFAKQVAIYLSYFGYERTLKLARDMGYPFEHELRAPAAKEPVGSGDRK
jgi:hypothetical protein